MALKRAGNNETKSSVTSVGAGRIQIQNWDDWFQNCGSLVSDLQEYEGFCRTYYEKQNSRTDVGRQSARQGYLGQHPSGFYWGNPKLPKWKLLQGLRAGLLGFLLVFFVVCVYGMVKFRDASSIKSILVSSGVWGGVVFVLLSAGILGFHLLQIHLLCQKLDVTDAVLRERIGYLPPKYRNSLSASTFYDLYTTYGVVTFSQAVLAVDDFLMSNNSEGLYLAVLFDVPYEQTGLTDTGFGKRSDQGLYTGNADALANPNLPDDIKHKTFSGADNAEERLQELIGLVEVKDQVRKLKNRMDFYGGGQNDRISGNHMVFLGPPGTGKTTIARIITRILYDFGYIKENKCVEIDGGYLKSPYAGQTAERASAIIDYAMGGVLFIDEAYMMMDSNGNSGAEATGVLLKAMEDRKHDFVVIFAGYEDNVNRLLSSNEGFASRIKHKIYFQNFSVDELMEIFDMQLRQYSTNGTYVVDTKGKMLLRQHFEKELRIPGFGNARVVRNALDAILDVHADAFMNGTISGEDKFRITESDIQSYVAVRSKQMQEDGRNFIASRNLDSSIVSLQELKGKTKSGSEHPDRDLERLTGLSVVKDEIQKMKAEFSFYDGSLESEGHHMVFLGPPGTGKTTVASIMTGYLYQMGLISENSYLDINGDFLRGMYVGHTGKRTEAVVQYSQGMVLFVDEAYLLASSGSGNNSFGREAIGVLLDAMEKYRKNFVVIFAGYEQEMSEFLDMNSGLRSRISLEFHFQSYTPHELAQMMNRIAKGQKFTVEKEVWRPLQLYLKTKVTDPQFGNGRYVRQLFEEIKKQHITNYANGIHDENHKYVITMQDVEPLLAE